jgi:hypothetical protein
MEKSVQPHAPVEGSGSYPVGGTPHTEHCYHYTVPYDPRTCTHTHPTVNRRTVLRTVYPVAAHWALLPLHSAVRPTHLQAHAPNSQYTHRFKNCVPSTRTTRLHEQLTSTPIVSPPIFGLRTWRWYAVVCCALESHTTCRALHQPWLPYLLVSVRKQLHNIFAYSVLGPWSATEVTLSILVTWHIISRIR